jgi:hypothetical protein
MKVAGFGAAAFVVATMAAVSSPSKAAELRFEERFTKTKVGFVLLDDYSRGTLTVTGPNGFHVIVYSERAAPSIELERLGRLDDGIYTYQLTAASAGLMRIRTPLDDGRDGAVADSRETVAASGSFAVSRGVIVRRGKPALDVTGGAKGDDQD